VNDPALHSVKSFDNALLANIVAQEQEQPAKPVKFQKPVSGKWDYAHFSGENSAGELKRLERYGPKNGK